VVLQAIGTESMGCYIELRVLLMPRWFGCTFTHVQSNRGIQHYGECIFQLPSRADIEPPLSAAIRSQHNRSIEVIALSHILPQGHP